MQPYVVKQGDFLLRLAYQFGFDPNVVWMDPSNADLRKNRPDSNVLSPGDVLYIPDQMYKEPALTSLATGTTNTFVSNPPSMTLAVKFVGEDPTTFASKAYTIQELDQLTGLVTDGDGVAKFDVPVNLSTVTVMFTDAGETYPVSVGTMDSMDSMTGLFKRLQNLGYIGPYSELDTNVPANNLGLLRGAIRAMKASQGSAGDGTSSSGAASVPAAVSASDPASDPVQESGAPPTSNPFPPDSAAATGSSDAASASPSTEDSAPSNGASPAASDDAGLDDNGILDADTTALLIKIHGY